MRANVYVTLKESVLDPQGDAVRRSLGVMGYEGVESLRIRKYIEVDIQGKDKEAAKKQLEEMTDKLLANPVIENYRVEIVEEQA